MGQQRTLPAKDTLSKAEAATLAGVTPRTIQRWIATGALTRYTVMINRVAVSKRELQTLLRGRAS
jgi:predicted site-specific integrase-resolvase